MDCAERGESGAGGGTRMGAGGGRGDMLLAEDMFPVRYYSTVTVPLCLPHAQSAGPIEISSNPALALNAFVRPTYCIAIT